MNILIKLYNTRIDPFNSKKIHDYMIKDRSRLMIYRSLAWFSLFIFLGMLVMIAGFMALLMNSSLIHDPRNNFHNGMLSLITTIVFGSPFWLSMLFKIIDRLYRFNDDNAEFRFCIKEK